MGVFETNRILIGRTYSGTNGKELNVKSRGQTTNELIDKIMIEHHLHDDDIGLWIT